MNTQTNDEEMKKEFFKEAKKNAQEMKDRLVKSANFYDKEKISERLYRMILYTIGRHDWYDVHQHRLLNIGIAFIAASLALSTFMLAIVSKISLVTQILGSVTVFCIFGTGLILVIYYNRRLARDHPYRKIVDIRSWYFIYNFPSGLKDALSKEFDEAKKQIKETIDAYEVFLRRWLEFSSDQDKFIEEDLEQVFILQLLQSYRYQAVKFMSKILFYGICATILFAFLTIISYVVGLRISQDFG